MSGAATNPDAQVVAYAASQLKKAMEVAHKIGAENFLVWGAREGYQNPLTADMPREMRLYAKFLKMAAGKRRTCISWTQELSNEKL